MFVCGRNAPEDIPAAISFRAADVRKADQATALIDAIADEWRAVGETVDPAAMPMTGLANAAIDRIAADPVPFATGLARYAESDLLCYRADSPPELVARQDAVWNPLLDWAHERYGAALVPTTGCRSCLRRSETRPD